MLVIRKTITLKKHQADWIDGQPRSWNFSKNIQDFVQTLIDKETEAKPIEQAA